MIRTTITAHIPSASLKELTFQINDRSLGGLALQRQHNYVMTGNRRVQMVTGIMTDRKRPNAIAEDKHQLRLWESCFRELQTGGLAVFPSAAEREHLRADFLILIDEARFVCYTAPRFGLYLNRAGRLFRVQPIDMPAGAPRFFGLDLYSFDIEAGDNVLVLAPEFVDLFDAGELIETFSALRQVSTVMAKLSDLAETYGEGLVKPWLAFHIQRTQEDQSTDGLGLKSKRQFPGNLPKSKVVRLENGNIFIPVKAAPPEPKQKPSDKIHLVEPEPTQIRLESKNGSYPSGSRTLAESERGTTRLDRLKTKDMASFGRDGGGLVKRLMNLFPGQVLLSRIVFFALLLLLLLLVAAGGRALIARNRRQTAPTAPTVLVVTPESGESVVTLSTDYEIEWEVDVNSLTVYHEGGGGRLLGTVKRGDLIWKLSEPVDGWVLIRLEDGRIGYVYAAMVGH